MSTPEVARTVFSAAHFIYIPLCVLAGVLIGWILGARASRAEVLRLRRLLEDHEARGAEERLSLRYKS
jgi:hypothetical protein